MKSSFLAATLFAVLTLTTTHAAENTAADAFQLARQTNASLAERPLVGVERTEEPGNEAVWKLQFEDENYKGNYRLVTIQNGKVVSDKAGLASAFAVGEYAPLEPGDLTRPLLGLRRQVDEMAAANDVKVHSVRYALGHREDADKAVWRILAWNEKGVRIGRMTLDARTGAVMSAKWGPSVAKMREADSGFEQFGRDVESTFRGVGADLEEFFTGKRTVDQD